MWKTYSAISCKDWSAACDTQVFSIRLYCKNEEDAKAVCEFLNARITGWEMDVAMDDKDAAKAEA